MQTLLTRLVLTAAFFSNLPLAFSQPAESPVTLSLDGSAWQIKTDPSNLGISQEWYQTVQAGSVATRVPWVIQDPFPGYHGVAWYWHSFTAPANPHPGGRCLIKCWAVGYKGTVWLNGINLGEHEGPDTPFVLDATDAIRTGDENILAIRVVDPTQAGIDGLIRGQVPGGNVFPQAGIEDSVELLVYPAVYFEDVFIRPNWQTGTIAIEGTVKNTRSATITANLLFSVVPGDSTHSLQQVFSPGTTAVQAQLQVENPRLWNLEDPFLYTITGKIWEESSNSYDQRVIRCGFRDFRVENGCFRLNGKRIFLRCAHTGQQDPFGLRVAYDPNWPLFDITAMKAMGFNAIRFFQAPGYRSQLELADEIGFLVYEEARGGWLIDYAAGVYEQRRNNQIRALIQRDRNHPSVVMWGLLNESPWWVGGESAEFEHARGALPLIRSLDDTRMAMIGSGRWDCRLGTGSLSNPGSSTWDCLLGNETPGAAIITPECQPGGPPLPPPALPIAGYVGPMGDVHVYPRVPHSAEIMNFMRTVGSGTKNVFVSEYGIASAMDLVHLCDVYQQYGYTHLEYAKNLAARRDRFMADWNKWNLAECFGQPADYFHACLAGNSSQRLLGINAFRSNPRLAGCSLTATVDTWTAGEGFITLFREVKPGMQEAVSDGFAPLRWCLFAEPSHLYRGAQVTLDVVLANEDVLAAGDYPVNIEVFDSHDARIASRQTTLHISTSPEPPLALPVYRETIAADWPTGAYRLRASFADSTPAAGRDALFYVTDAADMPPVPRDVVLWGEDAELASWLQSKGISCHAFTGIPQAEPELILVSRHPASPGGQAAFDDLMARVEAGSMVLFLSPEVFASGSDPTAYVPLASKGSPVDPFQTSFVYPKDVWAKTHPIFAGMSSGGLMDYTYYRELFTDRLWQNQDAPDEAAAGAIAASFAYYSGLRIGVYNRGKGRFILNYFQVRENLGTQPAAERLLRNMLCYLGQNMDVSGDFNGDHHVNLMDFSLLASQWLDDNFYSTPQWHYDSEFEAGWDSVANPWNVWSCGVYTEGAYSGWTLYNGRHTDDFIGLKAWMLGGPDEWGNCNVHSRGDVFTNPNWYPEIGMSWRPYQTGIMTPRNQPASVPGLRFAAPWSGDYQVDITFENRVPTGDPTGVYVLLDGSHVWNTQVRGFTESDLPVVENLANYTTNLSLTAGDTITFGAYNVEGQSPGHNVGVNAVITGPSDICGGPGFEFMIPDLNKNCTVDIEDLAQFLTKWLCSNSPNDLGCVMY